MNLELPERENRGDKAYFHKRLAPAFAMRRANGEPADREHYLEALKEGGDRKTTSMLSVSTFGQHRAVATCIVTSAGKAYENIRLFVRDETAPEGWLLLAWANEPAGW